MNKKIQLYINTIRYLKCSQLFYKVLHKLVLPERVQKCIPAKVLLHLFIRELDEDKAYLERFDCAGLLKDEVLLLNDMHEVEFATWTVSGENSHLWMFNLQYMEYLIPLAICYRDTKEEVYYQKLKQIIESWIRCFEKKCGDAWNPYTISERIQNWLIVMNVLEDKLQKDEFFRRKMECSLYLQYRHLQRNQEKHLLGNHYFENLKALILASIVFGDTNKTKRYLKQFDKQIMEQVLEDGMHYERSLMYHKIIMEDILRVYVALQQVEGYEQHMAFYKTILCKMLGCMVSFEGNLKRVPLFNDAGNNVAKPVRALERSITNYLSSQDKYDKDITALTKAGYYKYQDNDVTCIIDCGEIGPDYIPGHGHCDCFSYELYVNGIPFIVNSGTYQYQSSKRAYFRSTKAHNCFTINGVEQSQCWGEHRVAKRISKVKATQNDREFIGTCCFWNGKRAFRKMEFEQDSVTVHDTCENDADAQIQSYVHVSPTVNVVKLSDVKYQLNNIENGAMINFEVLQGERVILHSDDDICWYSEEFGKLEKTTVFEIEGNSIIYNLRWRTK